MKTVISACACLMALAYLPAQAQVVGPEVVTLKVREGYHYLQLIVSRSAGPPEVLKYSAREMKEDGAQEAVTLQVLAKLYREGYVVKSTYGGGDHFGNTNTLILVREK